MSTWPIFTILINNYNYAAYVGDAIESALSQSYPQVEVIVVDDGSTDASRDVIASFGNRIRILFKENGGQASALNAGFAASQGDIIALLDSDDLFLPNKAEEVSRVMRNYPNIDWCAHALTQFGEGAVQSITLQNGKRGTIDSRPSLRRGRLPEVLPATSALCFRRSLLDRVLPMPESIRITSDNYVKFASSWLGCGYYIDEPLARQRLHGGNAYTARQDAQLLKAEVQLRTAYWLRENYPALRYFASGLVADAVHALRLSNATPSAERQDLVSQYLSRSSILERLLLNLRLVKRRLRSGFQFD